MKRLNDLLLPGDPRLYQVCAPVTEEDRTYIPDWIADLHTVMEEIRAKYRFGRGIAAPQLGIMKRLIYLNVDQSRVIINPEISDLSDVTFILWDDRMSFSNPMIEVSRHNWLTVRHLYGKFPFSCMAH